MKIDWTQHAKLQLKEILTFYTKRNQSNAYSKKLRQNVNETIGIIRCNPFFGELIPDNCRQVSIGNFVLVYQIQDNLIQILSFRDGRQNIDNWEVKLW
jgi:toxin YoeB